VALVVTIPGPPPADVALMPTDRSMLSKTTLQLSSPLGDR
jgi:hypothetical protein